MKKSIKRYAIGLFALWFMISPALVPVLQAEPNIGPGRYLDLSLKLKGSLTPEGEYLPELVEARAWQDWFSTVIQTYDIMAEGSEDVTGFYGTLYKTASAIDGVGGRISDMQKPLALTNQGLAFLSWSTAQASKVKFLKNLLGASAMRIQHMQIALKTILEVPVIKFVYELGGAIPMSDDAAEFLRFLQGQSAATISNVAGAIGIGLCIIGFTLDSHAFATNENRLYGTSFWHRNSWGSAKNLAGITMALGQFVGLAMGMMAIPGGQVLAFCVTIAGLVWWCAKKIGDNTGSSRLKWRAAYKQSFNFLQSKDNKFKRFISDYRSGNVREYANASSLRLLKEEFQDLKKDADENAAKVYDNMENQAILVSYYDLPEFNLPPMALPELKDMWKNKTDLHTDWEIKDEPEKDWLDRVGDFFSFNSFWGSDEPDNRRNSSEINRILDRRDVKPVYLNPDYFLIKKFREFVPKGAAADDGYAGRVSEIEANRNTIGTERVPLLTFRIEQSPFNYLPLIEIAERGWDRGAFDDAFQGDCLFVAMKEMQMLAEVAETVADKTKDMLNDTSASLFSYFMLGTTGSLSNRYQDFEKNIRFARAYKDLFDLDKQCKDDELSDGDIRKEHESKIRELYRKLSNLMEPARPGIGLRPVPTPEQILKDDRVKGRLIEFLNRAARFNAEKGFELINSMDSVKTHLDTIAIMEKVARDREELINSLTWNHNEYKNFIEQGSALGVERNWRDWLAEWYAPIEDFKLSLNKFKDKLDTYRSSVENFRDRILKRKTLTDQLSLEEAVNTLQETIGEVMELSDRFYKSAGITFEPELDYQDENTIADYFPEKGFRFKGELVALDPEKEVDWAALAERMSKTEVDFSPLLAD